jgi:uncharacterized protein YegP (UPF0339 family)
MGKYEVYKSKDEKWRFRLKANNNEIIAVSQGYKTKQNAMNGIKAVKNNATNSETIIIVGQDKTVIDQEQEIIKENKVKLFFNKLFKRKIIKD